MLLLERAWANEPGLLTVIALCAALVCQQAWMIDRRMGVPFLRSRWAHLCVVTLVGGSVALGYQLFGLGAPGGMSEPAGGAVAAAAPIVPVVSASVRPVVALGPEPAAPASAPEPAPAVSAPLASAPSEARAMRAATASDLADSIVTSSSAPR